PMVGNRLDRNVANVKARRNITFPGQAVHADGVAALLAFQGDAQKIALQATEREVLVKQKSQLHQECSSSSRCSSGYTPAAFRPSKQDVSRSPLPALGPVAHRCTWP